MSDRSTVDDGSSRPFPRVSTSSLVGIVENACAYCLAMLMLAGKFLALEVIQNEVEMV